MSLVVDTDIAIHLRDGDPTIWGRLRETGALPVLSAVTLCELEAGAASDRSPTGARRRLLDAFLQSVPVLDFTSHEAVAYGRIIDATGHDRRRVLDRMIAAQAIAAGLPLATINGRDFEDVPGLELQVWRAPGRKEE